MSKQENSDLLLWEIEESNPGLGKKVREKLREVKDPEIGTDIIQLGLIRKVQLVESISQIRAVTVNTNRTAMTIRAVVIQKQPF